MDNRTTRRRSKDDKLLRQYAAAQYRRQREKLAREAGVSIDMVRASTDGRIEKGLEMIAKAHGRLKRWFDGLANSKRDILRQQIKDELSGALPMSESEKEKEKEKAE